MQLTSVLHMLCWGTTSTGTLRRQRAKTLHNFGGRSTCGAASRDRPEGAVTPSPRWPLLLGLVSLSSNPFLRRSRSSTVRPAHPTSCQLHRYGADCGCIGGGTPGSHLSRLVYDMESMLSMLSQHHAIGLQTGCMVAVLPPCLTLLDSHMYALWP